MPHERGRTTVETPWQLAGRRRPLGVMAVAVLLTVAAGRAHADVGLVLHESLNRGVSRFTGTGHSAVYLSRICAASPVELRWCTPEEEGSVISNYDDFGFGGDRDFEWTAVPLNVFLYGVDRARDAPLWASPRIKALLEERYRIGRLAGYCDAAPCVTDGNSEWRAMVGATFARTVDVFMVATSVEQDREFITRFNTRPNRNRFNGVTRNCADFARDLLNAYFAGGSRTDFVNDRTPTTGSRVPAAGQGGAAAARRRWSAVDGDPE